MAGPTCWRWKAVCRREWTNVKGKPFGLLTLLWASNYFKKKEKKKKKQHQTPSAQSLAQLEQRQCKWGEEEATRTPDVFLCSFRLVPWRSCNTESLGRLHWCEDKGLAIYPRAVTMVMVLSYCTAVHEWLNLWQPVCYLRVHTCACVCACVCVFLYFHIPPWFPIGLTEKKYLFAGL